MKKVFLLLLLFALGSGGAYYYYHILNKQSVLKNPWEIIPDKAILIIENEDTKGFWNRVEDVGILDNLTTIPFFEEVELIAVEIDSLLEKNVEIGSFFSERKSLLSIHGHESSADLMFIAPVSDVDPKKVLESLTRSYKNLVKVKIGGVTAYNLNREKGFMLFAVTDGYLLISTDTDLISETLKNLKKEEPSKYYASKRNKYRTALTGKSTKILIDESFLNSFINQVGNQKELPELFKGLVDFSFLDLVVEGRSIAATGFTHVPESSFLELFKKQDAKPFNMKHYVPVNTALFNFLGFENNYRFKKDFSEFYDLEATWESVKDTSGFDTELFFDQMTGSVGFGLLNANGSSRQLLIIESRSNFDMLKNLKKVSLEEEISFLGHQFLHASIKNLPSILFGGLYGEFEDTYYTVIDDYLILSDDLEVLMQYAKDLEDENVWGKSLNKSLFLENLPGRSNFSYFVDVPQAWKLILSKLNSETKDIFVDAESNIKSFRLLALQFVHQEDAFYATVNIEHGESVIEKSEIAEVGVKHNADFDTLLHTKPFVVRNHINNDLEIFVQDKRNKIYLLTQSGRKQWDAQVSGPIVTPVKQLDVYNNGKLQYIFATENKVYIIDRTGSLVENFPIELSDSGKITSLSVIDYNGTKNYRIAVAKSNNQLYLFDKIGDALDGWNPKELSFPLEQQLRHLKIANSDMMVFLGEGQLDVTNRMGESYDGFPVTKKGGFSGDVMIKKGDNFEASKITSINKSGLLTTINFKGETVDSIQLENGNDARFTLGQDALSNDFIILKQFNNQFSVFNAQGEFLFDGIFKSNGRIIPQYYDFGENKKLYILTSPSDGKSMMFDELGKQITENPILNDHEVGVIYYSSAKRFHIFKTSGSTYQEITIKEN